MNKFDLLNLFCAHVVKKKNYMHKSMQIFYQSLPVIDKEYHDKIHSIKFYKYVG